MGGQAVSTKVSNPNFQIAKASKENRIGIFPQHMSKSPTRIKIAHPVL
jgi:hypothetical protein